MSKKENRKKIPNFYVLALSIADLLYCSIYPPYILSSLVDPKWTVKFQVSCRIMTFLSYTLFTAGLMVITTLSLDRFYAIRYPLSYRRYKNAYIASSVNLFVYIYAAVCFCPLLVKKEWVRCLGILGTPSGVMWRIVPLAYIASVVLLVYITPGVLLISTNIYVFIYCRKRNLTFHKYPKQRAKPPRLRTFKSNMIPCWCSTKMNDGLNQASKASRKLPDESKIKKFKHTLSYKNGGYSQNTGSVITYHKDSANSSAFKGTKSEGNFSFENLDDKQDASRKYHSRSTNFGKRPSNGYNMRKNISRSEKQQGLQPKELKLATMTIALVMNFFITWLPFAISRFVRLFGTGYSTSEMDCYAAALTTVNSVINPYIVLATRKDVRQVLFR